MYICLGKGGTAAAPDDADSSQNNSTGNESGVTGGRDALNGADGVVGRNAETNGKGEVEMIDIMTLEYGVWHGKVSMNMEIKSWTNISAMIMLLIEKIHVTIWVF